MSPALALVLLLGLALCAHVTAQEDMCNPTTIGVKNDPFIANAVASARARFLASKANPDLSRLDVTVLIPDPHNRKIWHRGSYGANETAYPASTVKLTYMTAAIHWCLSQDRPPNCLDYHVRPMIVKSDNLQTGVVVDLITGAPNLSNLTSTSDPRWPEWIQKRQYTRNLLSKLGLLGNQIPLSKTYPTNSGQGPVGAESVVISTYGRNALQPSCAASLMLELMEGEVFPDPAPIQYMQSMLWHNLWDPLTSFGFGGLPPGSVIYDKSGVAYDTVEDIAYIKLPNGKEFIAAAFSNGYQPSLPSPYDSSILAPFMELLLQELKLDTGLPFSRVLTAENRTGEFSLSGPSWEKHSGAPDSRGPVYYTTPNDKGQSSATWRVELPRSGLYQVAAWVPAQASASVTSFSIPEISGKQTPSMNQRINGRWVKLGDYYMQGGPVAITMSASGSSGVAVANAIQVSMFPHCNGIDGTFC